MIQQFTHDYIGSNGVRSSCNVMIFSDDGDNFICFENIGIGVSVTNASELLATQIVALFGYSPEDCMFFETYQEYDNETFDEITYTWKNGEASNPSWKSATNEVKDLFLS